MAANTLTNGKVLENYTSYGKRDCLTWLISQNFNIPMATKRAHEFVLKRLKRKQTNLLRRTGTKEDAKLKEFLEGEFHMPIANVPICPDQSVEDLARTTQLESSSINDTLHDLNTDLNTSKKLVEEKEVELHEMKLKHNITLLDLKKAKTQLHITEMNLRKKSIANAEMEKSKKQLQAKLTSKTLELKRNLSKQKYLQDKQRRQDKDKDAQDIQLTSGDILSKMDEQENELEVLTEENNHYLLLISEAINAKELELFDEHSKVYSPELKNCVYTLLKNNVSASQIGPVIETVLGLVNMKANRLPSRSTVLNINIERLALAQKQLGEVFSTKENTTLLTDETSKFGKKYMGYEAGDADGNLWVLGLREIETKSAQNTLTVLQELLRDIDERCSIQDNSVSNSIMQHIVATMSDRAATEVKFNDLLETYRKEILPLVVSNYENFDPEEKSLVDTLSNFFCGLHALVAFAKTAQESVLEAEKGMFPEGIPINDKSFQKMTEPGTCRLVRTACKAFASGGDEKSGCFGPFSRFLHDFLHKHKLHSVPLVPYRGSRFNILFDNAASVYFLHQEMLAFLKGYGAGNRLLKSVLHDLQTEEFVAGAKTLGLLSRLVTGPLWCLLEDKNINVLDMNVHYQQLVTFFEDATNDTATFITGELLPFKEDTKVRHDAALECLLAPSPIDGKVLTMLQILLPALKQLTLALFKDHLPGGRYDGADETMRSHLQSAPKTSKFAESVFGNLDNLMRAKPNISTLASEAYIMFAHNKTQQWLDSKSDDERAALVKAACKDVKILRENFKERQQMIEEKQRARVKENIDKEEKARAKKLELLTGYTDRIVYHGLWQTENQVDNMVKSYNSVIKQKEALKAQVNFRRHVLQQISSTANVFSMSKKDTETNKRVQLNVPEMVANVKILVRESMSRATGSTETEHILTGKRVRHRFSGDTWYYGNVISQVPGFPTWFNIRYDEDEAIYSYELEGDHQKGELELVIK